MKDKERRLSKKQESEKKGMKAKKRKREIERREK